jgi:DNA-directed RNA polymerase specialized sigma24 family protein
VALKPDERTATVHHAAGFDYAEISGRLQWSLTKVNRCLYEGRIASRKELAPDPRESSVEMMAR